MHADVTSPPNERTLYKLLVAMAEAGSVRTAAAVLVALAEREGPGTSAHERLVGALAVLSPEFAPADTGAVT
jgi:hypothetical protein